MPRFLRLLLLCVVLGGVTLLALGFWAGTRETDDFIFAPQKAIDAAGHIQVRGEAADPPEGGPGILFVAIGVRRASLLDKWTLDEDDGSDLVREDKVIPPGHDDRELDEEGRQQMLLSQDVAGAVAERALGKRVAVTDWVKVAGFSEGGSPARDAGLRVGDVVVAAQGRPVRTRADLQAVLGAVRPGATVRISYRRGADVKTVATRTRPAPDEPQRALIGVDLAPPRVTLPVPVRYATGSIGGPSAGLAFALEIYASLTGRRIVGRHRVAVTGELDLDGRVGAIGGIKQKTIGAEQSRADVFLVPSANAAEARRWARHGLRIVPVRTFAEALAALRALPAA